MTSPPDAPGLPAYRAEVETRPDAVPRLRRLAFWSVVLLAAAATYLASAAQKYDEVTARVGRLDQAQALGQPELIALATRVAFILAGIISGTVLALFLSLCGVVDSRLLPGLRRRVRGVGLVGPALALGIVSTFPVAVGALALSASSPKDSPVALVYLALATAAVGWLFLRGRWSRLTSRRRLLTMLILVAVAALSLVV